MTIELTDIEIYNLIQEEKHLPLNYYHKLASFKLRQQHKEAELTVNGGNGSRFKIVLRQNTINRLDFSVILAYVKPNSNKLFRIRRYNGRSHHHTNKIEGNRFFDFHIHKATERYQEIGLKEDAYADPCDRYNNLEEALICLIDDCGFIVPGNQGKLF
jgi:hypothetical protein